MVYCRVSWRSKLAYHHAWSAQPKLCKRSWPMVAVDAVKATKDVEEIAMHFAVERSPFIICAKQGTVCATQRDTVKSITKKDTECLKKNK